MENSISYDDQCRILCDNSSLELIACVYCACRIDEAEGLVLHVFSLRKISSSASAMIASLGLMLSSGPSDVNMQLIAIALAVTCAVAVLASRTHAARRILDVACNVRQSFCSFLVQ